MILYNVTLNIDSDVHDEWLLWMQEEHIPEVMQTGFFTQYRMCRMISTQPDETGITYAIQYMADSVQAIEQYQQTHAPALQAKHNEKFNGKFVAFRSLLEIIHP